MLRHIRLLTVALIVLFTSVAVLGQGAQAKTPKPTLHEQAKKAGGKYVLKYKPNRGTVYPNIAELAKRSDLIVVGRIVGHKANLTANERAITQDFMVKVQAVVKGNLARGTAVLFSLPGGTHRFPDKTFAAMMPIGFKRPEKDGIYVLFLKSRPSSSPYKGRRLVSESQGIFALTDGLVEPADLTADDPVNMKYRKMAAARFLRELHQAVPRKTNNEKK
jgi:hypothetical protein